MTQFGFCLALEFRDDPLGRVGQGVGVLAQEQRASDSLLDAEVADRLGDVQDVRLCEGIIERRSPVAAGAEAADRKGDTLFYR